jgi:hypothetical protein
MHRYRAAEACTELAAQALGLIEIDRLAESLKIAKAGARIGKGRRGFDV